MDTLLVGWLGWECLSGKVTMTKVSTVHQIYVPFCSYIAGADKRLPGQGQCFPALFGHPAVAMWPALANGMGTELMSTTSKPRLSEVACFILIPFPLVEFKWEQDPRMEEPEFLYCHVEKSHLLHWHNHYLSERHTFAVFEPLHLLGTFCFSPLAELRHTRLGLSQSAHPGHQKWGWNGNRSRFRAFSLTETQGRWS